MTGFYTDSDAGQNAELERCRMTNVRNPLIDRVVLFLEDCDEQRARAMSPSIGSHKVQLVPMGRRMRFCDFFDKANAEFGGWVVMIANADVYLDDTLSRAFSHDLSKEVLCRRLGPRRSRRAGICRTAGSSRPL